MELLRKGRFAAVILGLVIVPPAGAEGWYTSMDLGQARIGSGPGDQGAITSLGLGLGRTLGEHFAVQLEWQDYAAIEGVSSNNCGINPPPCIVARPRPESALALRFRGELPMGDSWRLGATLGYADWKGEAFGVSSSGQDLLWSVESTWRVGERWRAGVEYLSWSGMEIGPGASETEFARIGLTLRYAF